MGKNKKGPSKAEQEKEFNELDQQSSGGSVNIPPTDNGADNDAVSDQSAKDELSAEPKKTTGSKSYSDMLRERTAQRQESFKRFSPDEVEKLKADKQKQVDDQTIIQK